MEALAPNMDLSVVSDASVASCPLLINVGGNLLWSMGASLVNWWGRDAQLQQIVKCWMSHFWSESGELRLV